MHNLVVCAVGLRKGDKPSSLPAAHSNGEKLSKVSTQTNACPRSPDMPDARLLSPPPLNLASRLVKSDWPRKDANSHAKMPQPPSCLVWQLPLASNLPLALSGTSLAVEMLRPFPVSSVHRNLCLFLTWVANSETVTSESAVLL